MKAIITKEYGDVNVLELQEVDKPTISKDEILVEVKATSVNPLDFRVRRGELKIMTGKTAPHILGSDYAGVVCAVGSSVTNYKVGDEVFGLLNGMKNREGTYAQFVKVTQDEIALKPLNIDFKQVATLPMIVVTALNALVNAAGLKSGQHVLIHGATGGVGMAAVQLAHSLGATVTAVCSTKNFDFAKSLGASDCLDYKGDEVMCSSDKYDVIFDISGHFPFSQAKALLSAKGVYVTTDATLSAILLAPLGNLFRSKKSKVVMLKPTAAILKKAKEIIEKEYIKAHIHKSFSLEEMKEAHKMAEAGGFIGKIGITI